MKKQIIALSMAFFSFGAMNYFYGQIPGTLNWYNGSKGMNTEKAYKAVKKRKSTPVVVAVIDSGMDIEHVDLKGKIWTNTDEIPGNNIDDDRNGYVDDVHGWSFLGGPNGNQEYARLEMTRIYAKLKPRFENVSEGDVKAEDKADYALYQKVKMDVEKQRAQYTMYKSSYEQLQMAMPMIKAQIASEIGKDTYTVEDVEKWKPKSPEMEQLRDVAYAIASGELSDEAISEAMHMFDAALNYQLNEDYNDREFIGDNPDNFSDTHYGTSDVEGPDALHGTHVGGIIGAVRKNGMGNDGVADNVQLMSVRTVPNGDEADKDVALAIRYAADNGASVINMSFGKAYSPYQKEVYEAMAYADSKGVLLVHAAGNDGANIDVTDNFPTSMYTFQTMPFKNFLTIGASTRYADEKLAANFSNYGQAKVDVFAPGYEIWSTVPQSDYKNEQGTSMAAPMVAGAAAFLKSYFPELTMTEIKQALLTSAKSYKGVKEEKPGSGELVDFGTLSVTGGTIDLPAAVKECMKMEKAKK
jgi:cell wall-associated protease